jgi:hypothetical protein
VRAQYASRSLTKARAGTISELLNSPFLPQFFQLIKAGSALSDMGKQGGELSVRGPLREFQQDLLPWTGDALRVGKVSMHYPVKCVNQLFFRIHSARPS